MYSISNFSKKTGFSSRMLRHFEELELLIPIRNTKNYRSYSEKHTPTAIKIKSFQKMGFSLKEIKTILSMDVTKIEENLTDLYKKKNEESDKIKLQLSKILTVQNAIKNGENDFSFINQIDEVPLAEREIIIRASVDLNDRVVRGFMPRMESIVSDFIKTMSDDHTSYSVHSCVFRKYGEWFKELPQPFFAVCEAEDVLSYFLIAFSEENILKLSDEMGMVAGDLANKKLIDSLGIFSLGVMEKFSSSWKKEYPSLKLYFKGITNELNKVESLFAFHDVVLTLEFKADLKDDNATFTIALPYNVVKTIDKIS